ncbi:MAG: YqaJ viral recombinase family protein [Candidatus Deferrimicrobiaceae bacterium]
MHAITTTAPPGPTIDHASYLGASDIGPIVGEGYLARDESDIWGEKMGHLAFESTIETELGNTVERPIMELWAKRNGVTIEYPGTLLHPIHKWAGATADAWIPELRLVVEFKYVGGPMFKHWGPAHLDAAGAPPGVVCQNVWQTWILTANGYPAEGGLIIGCLGTELREYQVPLDDELSEDLQRAGREWWIRHVVNNVRPEGRRGLDLVNAIHPANVRDGLEPMTPRIQGLAEAYLHAKEQAKLADGAINGIGVLLRDLVGSGSGFEGNGYKVTWKADRRGQRSLLVTQKKGKAA